MTSLHLKEVVPMANIFMRLLVVVHLFQWRLRPLHCRSFQSCGWEVDLGYWTIWGVGDAGSLERFRYCFLPGQELSTSRFCLPLMRWMYGLFSKKQWVVFGGKCRYTYSILWAFGLVSLRYRRCPKPNEIEISRFMKQASIGWTTRKGRTEHCSTLIVMTPDKNTIDTKMAIFKRRYHHLGIEVSFQGCSFYIWMIAFAENTSSLASGKASIPMLVKFNNDVRQQVMAMQGTPKQINICCWHLAQQEAKITVLLRKHRD